MALAPSVIVVEIKAYPSFSISLHLSSILFAMSVKERLNEVSGLKLKQMLLDLANQFSEQGHTFYDCDNMQELKPNIDNISNYIVSHNVDISIYKNDFDDLVEEKQKLVDSYCKRNGAPKPQQNLSEKYTKDLYRRLGNLVIEGKLNYEFKQYKSKFTKYFYKF